MMYPFVVIGAFLYGHFKVNGTGAIHSVKSSKIPILILHGKGDLFVPYQMAEEIYNSAAGKRELYICEKADHGMSYMTDPKKYETVVIDFITSCLNDEI